MKELWKGSHYCIEFIALCLAVGICSLSQIPSASCSSSSSRNSGSHSSGEQQESTEEQEQSQHHHHQHSDDNKLLIILLDGFRWDYYERQKGELRGFPLFLEEGVQVQWVEPVFPSLSYPAWATISTGLYPENHGILGNYMFDLKLDEPFDFDNESSTSKLNWWQDAEPLWTTATKQNKKCFLRFWSRCDVPFDEVVPEKCSGYRVAKGVQVIRDTLNMAIEHLQKDYQLAMVYGEHIDNIGHQFGPDSEELKQAILDVDDIIYDFLDKLTDTGLDEKVNVVIVSDHGMTWIGQGSGTVHVPIKDFIKDNDVYKVLDSGAVMSISPYKSRVDYVYQQLKGHDGFDVYRKEEIPEYLHYKNHRLVQEILLVARPQHYLQGLQSPKQIPRSTYQSRILRGGTHGYYNVTDMRTIFFAKGPDFKKGIVHPPIDLVDEYQLFSHLLKIPAQSHNGSWAKVSEMLVSSGISANPSFILVFLSVPLIFLPI